MPGLEGTSLGRYRLKRRLSHGGMSEVYLAYDERMHRDVAIKVVSSSHSDYIERFRREAEAIGRLEHDHILPAFDTGEQEPWHYLVMPYIGYSTLRQRLENGPLSLEEAGEMLQQIADGLQYAHDNGIIHRDIKPSNILLRDDHYAYLADFGLAKALVGASDLTQTGTLLGTPEYMAPELADGPATTSSDLYALGILLYEMVTGRVPFIGDTPMAVYFKQMREQPIPPARLNPAIPRPVEQVILRALEKDPRRRFQTARALAQAYMEALNVSYHLDADEISSHYSTIEMEENKPTFVISPHSPLQEEKLVLPVDPLAAPSAIPSSPARRRGGYRSAFRRNRGEDGSAFPPQPAYSETIIQEPARATPAPAFPIQRPARPPAPRPRRPYRYGSNPFMITGVMGLILLLMIVALILFASFNRTNTQTGTDATATSDASASASNTARPTNPAGTPTNTSAKATATANALSQQQAVNATATAITGGTPILKDSLTSDTNGRWPDDGTTCTFTGGTYHVIVKQADTLLPCESNVLSFDNAAIQVDVTLLSGNDTGLIFRANNDQFYDFEINNQGAFFFRRHDAGGGVGYNYLIHNTVSGAIASTNQKNTLLVIANGSDFRLFINGSFVGERQDSTYTSGQMGFVVGTLSPNTNGEGSFSNLNVFQV